MPKTTNYTKPPVSEALIDIRIDPLSEQSLPLLEGIHSRFLERFPNKKIRHRFAGSVQVQGSQVVTAPVVSGPIGYWFESKDRRKIIQVRIDGFTFNRLKPDPSEAWPGWDKLQGEAREAWDVYVDTVNVDEITRFAIRYINTIVIPEASIELYDYFTAPPRLPEELPYKDIIDFQSAVTIKIPEQKAVAVVRYAPAQQQNPGSVSVTLDIDVFRTERVSVSRFPLWETLDQFRNVKNAIFESNLLPRAKELFR